MPTTTSKSPPPQPVVILSRGQKLAQGRLSMRQELWPNVTPDQVWSRKRSTGFATIPRPMPVILVIMDSLSVGKPVSTTYLDLWCRAFDESFVRLDKPHEMAFAAGFTTSRGPHVWAERMDILRKLGFIELAPGAQGPRGFALIYNPYHVIRALKDAGRINAGMYNALLSAANGVGATDLQIADMTGPDPAKPPAPSRKRPFPLSAVV
jgi:hypothetical protein